MSRQVVEDSQQFTGVVHCLGDFYLAVADVHDGS